jgi:predicted TPR repeat methyltransferase
MGRHSLEWITSATSRDDSESKYNEWADTYDKDLTGDWEYKLPAFIGDLFAKYVKGYDSKILDAGAGTGLGGEYVRNKGYRDLFGIDMSEGMLREARRKEIYSQLDHMILGERLGFPDDHFDAVLSVGTIGTAPPESFDDLIRTVKPGGFIVFSLMIKYYDEPRFHEKMQSLEEAGKWRLVERAGPILGLPGESQDSHYYGFVYEVL